MHPTRIAIVTCRDLPEPDPDHEPLRTALADLGAEVHTVPWDAETPSDPACDLYILRATWNYYHFPQAFLEWCRSRSARAILLNPFPVVEWNCNKRYLIDLAARDVPIVPSEYFPRASDPQRLTAIWQSRGWPKIVLKPTVSAASFQTQTFEPNDREAALQFLRRQLPDREMMAQPFIDSTQTAGEKSIAWIDGEITHAWIKRPRFAGEHEQVEPTEDLSESDRTLVQQVLPTELRRQIFYARIDVMYDADQQPLLSELELIEPSLQFRFSPRALERFAHGLIRRAAP